MNSLPTALIESLKDVEGFDEQSFKDVHASARQVTSVRLNPAKPLHDDALQHATVVPWCNKGRYLDERPSFTLDPAFHGGAYYVQEASSMFIDFVIKQLYKHEPPKHVLDACAAPGGKSTLLSAALPDSFIVSNEVIKTRVTVLAENITKWGSSNVVVSNNDPKDFKRLPAFFNLMVVDAPCSGSGLFRKDANAIEEWSEANVELCSMRQQRIVADVIVSLQQNGYLIYSTCSFSKQENEDICDWIVDELKLSSVKIAIDSSWGVVETTSSKHGTYGYRFYPDKVKGEGFFVACFQQQNFIDEYQPYQRSASSISKQEETIIDNWLEHADDCFLSKQGELIIAFPTKWQQALSTINKALNLRKSGVAVGEIKGKDFIPHHELALSNIIKKNAPCIALNKDDALKYLRRQDLALSTDVKGWAVAKYNNINLGWMKVLPNRINNYYPVNWRILKP